MGKKRDKGQRDRLHHESCSGPCRACRYPQGAEHPQPGTEGAGGRVGLGVLLPQPQLQVSAGDKAATEGGSIPLQVPLSPGPRCCQPGADPGLQQHWGEWQCWRSPRTGQEQLLNAALVAVPGSVAVPAWSLRQGCAAAGLSCSGAVLGPLPLPALAPSKSSQPPAVTLCMGQSLPSTAARPRTEGFPALEAGR